MSGGGSRKRQISECSEVKGVALNLTHSPEKKVILGTCRSSQGRRRPCGERARDECEADTPGSKTASSCPTTGK